MIRYETELLFRTLIVRRCYWTLGSLMTLYPPALYHGLLRRLLQLTLVDQTLGKTCRTLRIRLPDSRRKFLIGIKRSNVLCLSLQFPVVAHTSASHSAFWTHFKGFYLFTYLLSLYLSLSVSAVTLINASDYQTSAD